MYNEKDKRIVLEKLKRGFVNKQIYPFLSNSTYSEMMQYYDELIAEGEITLDEIKSKRKEFTERKKKEKETAKAIIEEFIKKIKTGQVTLEDAKLYAETILRTKSLVNIKNVKIGILGFIKAGSFKQARKFYNRSIQRVGQKSSRGIELLSLEEKIKAMEQTRDNYLNQNTAQVYRD